MAHSYKTCSKEACNCLLLIIYNILQRFINNRYDAVRELRYNVEEGLRRNYSDNCYDAVRELRYNVEEGLRSNYSNNCYDAVRRTQV